MKLAFITLVFSSIWIAEGNNITNSKNQTKRNLSRDIQTYGDPNVVYLYADNSKQPPIVRNVNLYYPTSRQVPLVGVASPVVKVFEPKVAAQQVLYEYEQTPTNAVSNVHVKQLFQPSNHFNQDLITQEYKPLLQNNAQNVVSSETIVAPVQHSSVIQNTNQPYSNVKLHPLYNIQPQYIGPKKYVYVNGKIIYDPSSFQPQTYYHSSQQYPQRQPVLSYVNHNSVPRQNLVPPSVNPPITQNRFHPPPKSQLQPIDTPSSAPQRSERPERKQPKHEAEEKPVEESRDEDDEERYYHSEDDEDSYDGPVHEKYSFDEDDEEEEHLPFRDHEDVEDDDEEEDSNRGSTRYITAKVKKYPKKFYKSEKKNGKYYSYPERKYPKDSGKKQSMRYKSYKYLKDSGRYPKQDGIEGRYSEHVPVTHKQKIFKEKWYVSKSSADRQRFDDSD